MKFPSRSKCCSKSDLFLFTVCVIVSFLEIVGSLVTEKCRDSFDCGGNGKCINETCDCREGWQGPHCQFCGGKIRLEQPEGTITDGLGNYSLGSKCTWLVDATNSSITLHLEEFATECNWDNLYIFDGDSVSSPLLAVYSGIMYTNNYAIRKIPEVIASSGSVLIHFYSDYWYNTTGFNLTYRLNSCPSRASGKNCSGNGICIDGSCTCDMKWAGAACHIKKCRGDCGNRIGRERCEANAGCVCDEGFKGSDCHQPRGKGYWETVSPLNFQPPGSASHGAVVWRDSMYVVGGESYKKGRMLYSYNFVENIWKSHHEDNEPSVRYGHSTVIYGDKIFIYGGDVGDYGPTLELWTFDLNADTWENITRKNKPCIESNSFCAPLKLVGHTATVVANPRNKKTDRMVVIFGYSPQLGFLNTVQEYHFGTKRWQTVNTNGYPVKGGYGHTANWDSVTSKIYVCGGYVSESASAQMLSKNLYSYEPDSKTWNFLSRAPSARFLHTATFVSRGLMLVFGGNTHNKNSGAKCHSSELLAYDVACDTWHTLSLPKDIQSDISRYGHSAVTFRGSLYIYGGFNGQILFDVLKYTPSFCKTFTNQESCASVKSGIKCAWNRRNNQCVAIQDLPQTLSLSEKGNISHCPKVEPPYTSHNATQGNEFCLKFEDCISCVQPTAGCVWCGNQSCTYRSECKEVDPIVSFSQCPLGKASICKSLHTCLSCSSQSFCDWREDDCVHVDFIDGGEDKEHCPKACAEQTSCYDCTREQCIWCQNKRRCLNQNAYVSSFPYGQCMDYAIDDSQCRTEGPTQCSSYSTCSTCREDPACGWCDDGSETGTGRCMPGGYTGPTLLHESSHYLTCPSDRWHFTTCPHCQCNGHARCHTDTDVCQDCGDFTMGPHCETCSAGYWGSPANGAKCRPCECNRQATECHPETGKCYCMTKGVIGDHCEKCDALNRYLCDPTNNGSCYYELTTNYGFIFNLSKKTDEHFNQIMFRDSPDRSDIDADFTINCSAPAKVNVTVVRRNSPGEEETIYANEDCANFKSKFGHLDYDFGNGDNTSRTTFYVNVYNFQTPLWIRVSFAQYPKNYVQQLPAKYYPYVYSDSKIV